MKILPYVLYLIGVIAYFILGLPYGLLLTLLFLIAGTVLILIRFRNKMDQEKDYSTSNQYTSNRLLGGIVGCIIIFILYVLKVIHIL